VIASNDGEIVSVRLAVSVCIGDPLSFTPTVKLGLPEAVGVPEITPPGDRFKPAGRLPAVTDQV
jgi:hypothetical protein